MPDVPFQELIGKANEAIKKGFNIYQKWTCGACGERCCSEEANVLHTSMIHEDCPVTPGYETDCETIGGGLLSIFDGRRN